MCVFTLPRLLVSPFVAIVHSHVKLDKTASYMVMWKVVSVAPLVLHGLAYPLSCIYRNIIASCEIVYKISKKIETWKFSWKISMKISSYPVPLLPWDNSRIFPVIPVPLLPFDSVRKFISPLSFISLGLLFFSFILSRQWAVVALKKGWISSWKSASRVVLGSRLSTTSTFTKVCLRLPLVFCGVQNILRAFCLSCLNYY